MKRFLGTVPRYPTLTSDYVVLLREAQVQKSNTFRISRIKGWILPTPHVYSHQVGRFFNNTHSVLRNSILDRDRPEWRIKLKYPAFILAKDIRARSGSRNVLVGY